MLRIVPLGGLGEIGLNSMVFETGSDAVLVDCGIMFPQENLGVDVVVPDLSYTAELAGKLKALVLTHGHEDHVGAVPFLLRERPELPVYGTRFTLGLLAPKLAEHGLKADLRELVPGAPIEVGQELVLEGIRVTHSIPDGVGLGIDTPEGRVVHTGDFKVDHTPIDDRPTDLERFAALGKEGVLCLLSDSTNSDRAGVALPERQVGAALEAIFARARARVLVATFASNIHRVQQLLDLSRRFSRKVVLVGRSMQQNVQIASALGYLEVPPGTIVDADEGKKLRHEQVTVLSTGAQGEPRSALMRMALGDPNAPFPIDEGDLVVISSRFIPGNEVAINSMVNHLARRGAEVVFEGAEAVHTSGHACQEEQKLMLRLTRPRHFVPIHGEYRHLVRHARTAQQVGLADRDCHLLEDGDVLRFEDGKAIPDGRVLAGRLYVESRTGPDVSELVLKERSLLAETGLVTAVLVLDGKPGGLVREPELSVRGLAADASTLAEARREVVQAVEALPAAMRRDVATVQEQIRLAVRRAWKRSTERKPVVLPVVIEL